MPRWVWAGGGLVVLAVVAAMAFAIFEPIQVLPRLRLAPGFSLDAADDGRLTSEDGRGVVTLYGFSPLECGDDATCNAAAEVRRTMADAATSMAAVDFGDTEVHLVIVALDAPAPADLPADGPVTWLTGDVDELRTVVGSGFEVFYETDDAGAVTRFDPRYVLVDGNGVVRGDYRYETLTSTADKVADHAEILAEEIRYAAGATALAYEAAHLFLCYP
ncbi:MAG: hypothetical protein ACRBI6_13590 [Acidimicrobiales bacterium]